MFTEDFLDVYEENRQSRCRSRFKTRSTEINEVSTTGENIHTVRHNDHDENRPSEAAATGCRARYRPRATENSENCASTETSENTVPTENVESN